MTLWDFFELLKDLIEGSRFAGNTYLVGGAVRDHLLGKDEIWDFDLAVEIPYGARQLWAHLSHTIQDWVYGFRRNSKFGTVSFFWEDARIDINYTRKEHYRKKSRFPTVQPGTLLDDVMRRDFTVNALVIEPFSGDIIDLSGLGLTDLESGILRTLKDPFISLKEDPLRILRAVRFAARFDFCFCPLLWEALKENAHLVNTISGGRRKMERELMKYDGNYKKAKELLKEIGVNA